MQKKTIPVVEQALDRIKLMEGKDLRVTPIPPLCLRIWECAQAAGIALGTLYVLKESLEPVVRGACDTDHNIWVVWDEAHPEETAICLLHEVSHAKRGVKQAHINIDEDWDDEAAVFQLAREMAVGWGMADLLTEEQLGEKLQGVESLREGHWQAANLAGTADRRLARAAYQECHLIAGQRGWTVEQFEQALYGWADDPTSNAALLDFPRSCLRSSWRQAASYGDGFGPQALLQGEDSANLLRSALREMARGTRVPEFQRHQRGTWEADFCLLSLEDSYELPSVLAAAQTALLNHPDGSALAAWWVYGEEHVDIRVYRLSVSYENHQPDAELWVLTAPERRRELTAEATWQRYIAGWLAPRGPYKSMVGLRREPLRYGLKLYWEFQSPSRD
jgi:hypothetical protein